jgi:hypothetical protein
MLMPFKMYKNTSTPGIHFDDDWFYQQIKSFETRRDYFQKWRRSVKTKFQINSTIAPDDFKLYNKAGTLIKSFAWTLVASGGSLGLDVYECEIDFTTGVAIDGIYFLYLKAELLSVKFEAISEPILIQNTHPNTLLFSYKNSVNDFGVIFSTGSSYNFICEAGVMDYEPMRERSAYVDEIQNTTTLSATPYRQFKLYIGEAPGVAPYVVDILNRIFSCDNVKIEGLQYETPSGSKWEVSRVKGYPLIGASIDLVEAKNNSSLQLSDGLPITPGVVLMFDLDSNFFGNTASVEHITEFEQQ